MAVRTFDLSEACAAKIALAAARTGETEEAFLERLLLALPPVEQLLDR